MPDENLIDKARALHQRSHPQVRRVVVAVVGFLLLCVGIALLVLPGPGLLVIAAFGAGRFSLDNLVRRRVGGTQPA